jgi:hypothetical protein
MKVTYKQDQQYISGMYNLAVELTPDERTFLLESSRGVPFNIPQFTHWWIRSSDGSRHRGLLTPGGWIGRCESFGLTETQNTTPVATVIARLEANINEALAGMLELG